MESVIRKEGYQVPQVDLYTLENMELNKTTSAELFNNKKVVVFSMVGANLYLDGADQLQDIIQSYQDIIDLSVTITPSSTSSKILVKCILNASANANQRFGVRIVRDGSMILPPIDYNGQGGSSSAGASNGYALGNRTPAHVFGNGVGSNAPTQPSTIELLDTPSSTSSLTYKVQAFCESTSYLYINNCQTWGDDASKYGAVSTLTVMEVAG